MGVNGPFEARTTSWKAKIEPPNGIKAEQRLRRYKELIEKDKERCLGSYCFFGDKNKNQQLLGMECSLAMEIQLRQLMLCSFVGQVIGHNHVLPQ